MPIPNNPRVELKTDIDIHDLKSELKRIEKEVELYYQVREVLVSIYERNPDWDINTLASIVMKKYNVSEEFMNYMTDQHLKSIEDSIRQPRMK